MRPPSPRRARRFVVAATTVAVAGALALGACGGDDGGGDGGSGARAPSPTVAGATQVDITASNFEFEPDAFEIGAGEDFTVNLSSQDSLHDFVIEGADGFVEAGLGETESGGFRIDEAGEYTFYCSIPGHRTQGMEGTITVN